MHALMYSPVTFQLNKNYFFPVGTNPLDRTNCTGATTSSKITIDDGASMASVTTKVSLIKNVLKVIFSPGFSYFLRPVNHIDTTLIYCLEKSMVDESSE